MTAVKPKGNYTYARATTSRRTNYSVVKAVRLRRKMTVGVRKTAGLRGAASFS